MKSEQQPTLSMYSFIQNAYDFFNDQLFGNELPTCMLTFQRDKAVMGYFASDRWTGGDNTLVHEIALNPSYFITHRPLELMQTLVHEMVHLWQHEYGKPSHRTYHNKEWADKMESIGLMPSSTGKPGGKRTGQKMSDYPLKNGAFYLQCVVFAQSGYQLPYYDRWAKVDSAQVREPVDNAEIQAAVEEVIREVVEQTVQQTAVGSTEAFEIVIPVESDIEPSHNTENPAETAGSREDAEHLLMQPFSEQFDIDVGVLSAERENEAAAKKKTTFLCQSCGDRAWGKSSLNLWCGKCQVQFVALTEDYVAGDLSDSVAAQ